MRRLVFLFLFFIISTISYSQIINSQLILSNDSDTSYWKKYQEEIFKKINVIQHFSEKQVYHFRFVYHGQTISEIVDLWKENESKYKLTGIIYTKEYTPYEEEPTNRYFFEKIEYDSIISAKLNNLIITSEIESIPTDKKILGWSRGFDGIEITIESLSNNNYRYKQYWTPSAQDSLKEGLAINSFFKEVWNLLEIKNKERDFATRIPFESYNTGGPATVSKILTKKERKLYKKERKNYRQQLLKNTGADS